MASPELPSSRPGVTPVIVPSRANTRPLAIALRPDRSTPVPDGVPFARAGFSWPNPHYAFSNFHIESQNGRCIIARLPTETGITVSGVKVLFVDPNDEEHVLSGQIGQNVMALAVAGALEGVEAECGGACSCATCHIYVAPEWMALVGEPNALEAEMLDFARAERCETSRLSCQIKLRAELDGLKVRIAGG